MTPAAAPDSSENRSEPRRYASGRQYELRRGDALAVVTELAAGLRSYSRGGVLLTETYGDAEIPPGAAGITLAPWANRVEDGVWYLTAKSSSWTSRRSRGTTPATGCCAMPSYSPR